MVLGGSFMAGEVKDMDKLLRARSIGTGSQEGLTAAMARANLANAFKEADTDGSGQVFFFSSSPSLLSLRLKDLLGPVTCVISQSPVLECLWVLEGP